MKVIGYFNVKLKSLMGGNRKNQTDKIISYYKKHWNYTIR